MDKIVYIQKTIKARPPHRRSQQDSHLYTFLSCTILPFVDPLSNLGGDSAILLRKRGFMKKALKYNSNSTSEFWWIDFSDSDLCINYGPRRTVGTYEIHNFDTPELCRREGELKITEQVKKGFVEDYNFDFLTHTYIDTDQGIHKKTSHPHYRDFFSDNLYYSEERQFAPFGNKRGLDVLRFIEQQLVAQVEINFAQCPRLLTTQVWEQAFFPVDTLERSLVQAQAKDHLESMANSDITTFSLAFAQIKTTGELNGVLKQKALTSLKRFIILNPTSEKNCDVMYENLYRFAPTSY